jgi:hypothetical protein
MNNNNNSVVIETPNSPRSVVMTPPQFLRNNRVSGMSREDLDNLRRMRRTIMSFSNAGLIGRRINFNNGNRPNASNYTKNEKKMKKNANENKNTNRITWKNKDVNNFPIDPITINAFKPGDKAVKIKKLYLSPNSFRKMARMSMTSAINANGNMILFENPLTRENVKKSDLKFVVLQNKKTKK